MLAAATTTDQPLRRQAAWVVGCRVVGILATTLANILVARVLGPSEFGVYLLLTTVAAVGSLLAMAGLNEAALRFISESLGLHDGGRASAYARRALRIAAITSLLTALAATAALAAIQAVSGKSFASSAALALLAIGILALACQQLVAEMLRAYGNLPAASFFSGGQSGGPASNVLFLVAFLVVSSFLVAPSATLALALVVGSVCITCPIVCFAFARTTAASAPAANGMRLNPGENHELLAVGGMLLLNQLLAFSTQQLDILLAGGLLTSADLGLYGTAKRSLLTAAMPVQMAALTVVSSVPRLYAQSRTAELQKLVRGAATAAAIPSLLALAVLVLFSRPIFSFLLRDAFADASGMVLILAAGHLALVLFGNPQYVLTMTGRQRAVLAVNFASAVLMVVVGIGGGVVYGATGFAVGSSLSLLAQNVALWWIAHRELGVWTHVNWNLSLLRKTATADAPSLSRAATFASGASPEPLPSSSGCA